jgi:hypothetical protein
LIRASGLQDYQLLVACLALLLLEDDAGAVGSDVNKMPKLS